MKFASMAPAVARHLVILLLVVVGGCASKWYKLGATSADFQIDKGECVGHAYSEVPAAPAVATIGGGYTTPVYTTCSGFGYAASCYSSGGEYVPPINVTYDANTGTRSEVFKGCMYSKGWELLTREQAKKRGLAQ